MFNKLHKYELSTAPRIAVSSIAGLLALGLVSCGEAEVNTNAAGVQKGNVTYFDNGTRAYTITLPSSSKKTMAVLERCQDTNTLETSYVDDSGRLAAVTAQEEPVKCSDGRLTLEDFSEPAKAPMPTSTAHAS